MWDDDSDFLHDVAGKEIKIQHRQELVFNNQCYVKLEDHMKEINALNKEIARIERERRAWRGLANDRWQQIMELKKRIKELEYQLTELEGPEQ
jgi:chromosome segregation ATPase